ncbi:DUF3040 domain-containing protein [Arthrobacter celericrescens]|uniref:DUF3040 domain-containing protein n=1 Tax=Arthrobacter celericrescens TaxID=2320851 RepID=UPI000EA20185|nr:DUF3040 domain-containing protein [Arthrobacter celericrescens]
MALTEYERHQLELLAEQLSQEDPRLAARLCAPAVDAARPARRVAGAFTLLVGCFVLIAGIATQLTALGTLGFAIMATGAYLLFAHTRLALRLPRAAAPPPRREPPE